MKKETEVVIGHVGDTIAPVKLTDKRKEKNSMHEFVKGARKGDTRQRTECDNADRHEDLQGS